MNVRFKMTNKGEIAILSRRDYEHFSPKHKKPMKIASLRVLSPARIKRLLLACRSFRKKWLIELPVAKTRCVCFASGAVKRSSTSRTRLTSDRVTFPILKKDGEREQPRL